MKKRFIVLVDFSDHSDVLLSLAHKWAKKASAELLLIHHSLILVPGIADREIRDNIIRSNERDSLEKLQIFAHETVGSDPTIKFHAESYNLAAAILDLHDPEILDYVFVGINEKSPIESFFTESTAVKLAEETKSIIIAVPTSRNDFTFGKLYVGIRHPYQLKDLEFQRLLSIKHNMINSVNFFSVLKPGSTHDETDQYLKSICATYENQVQTSYEIIEKENVIAGIKEYMWENNGVLVIQKGSRSLIDMFRKFFTKEVILHAEIPVIILP